MPDKKYVYVCYGWDDCEGGQNYITFNTERQAKKWVKDSEKITSNYWDGTKDRSVIDKELEEMHSERNDNFKYEKMEIIE